MCSWGISCEDLSNFQISWLRYRDDIRYMVFVPNHAFFDREIGIEMDKEVFDKHEDNKNKLF